jgi:hypothetical protein
MNKKHYAEQKRYKIFALLLSAEEEFCFIGKTSSPRLSAIYSNHICGRVGATKGYFDLDNERPRLYLLEELTLTTAEAYKHVLAWIHIFSSNGYASINHEGQNIQAKNPLPDTTVIIQGLNAEPLEKILQRTFIARPADANSPPMPKEISESQETAQMNVRMKKSDKQRFLAFCDRLHLNQKEGFSILLDHAETEATTVHLDTILEEKARRILELEDKNRALQSKLSTLTADPKERFKKEFSFFKKGIENYLLALFPQSEQGIPMKPLLYRRFMKQKDPAITYRYPDSDGFMRITLEGLLWGLSRKRALFIVGQCENGTYIRLRYYPKDDFLGYPLKESPYAFEGSRWYVGYKRAADGAMNLVAAFPLSVIDTENQPPVGRLRENTDSFKRPSLDEQIFSADLRR